MTDTAKPNPLIELLITLPSMLIMMAALVYLSRSIHEVAGLKFTDALKGHV